MNPIVEAVLEIVKIAIPSLIVFFTAYFMLKTYLDKQHQLKALELKQGQQATTIPMKFQAYERLSLFCERIAIPNLLLRLTEKELSAAELRVALLITIQQEFEYNITQQVYISEQLWRIVKAYRDTIVATINGVSEHIDRKASAMELQRALLQYEEASANRALDTTLSAIKKEASLIA